MLLQAVADAGRPAGDGDRVLRTAQHGAHGTSREPHRAVPVELEHHRRVVARLEFAAEGVDVQDLTDRRERRVRVLRVAAVCRGEGKCPGSDGSEGEEGQGSPSSCWDSKILVRFRFGFH